MPFALERTYLFASREWGWQWAFPARQQAIDPRSRIERRRYVDEKELQRAIKRAIRESLLSRSAGCHTFRLSVATHLREAAYDIRTVQEFLDRRDLRTLMICIHVLSQGGQGCVVR
jgi:site-specific recombinase XerD